MTKPSRRRRKETKHIPPPSQLTSLAQNRREPPKNGPTKTSTKAKKLPKFSSIFENDPSSEEDMPPAEPRVRSSSRKRKKKSPRSNDSDDEFQESPRKRKKKPLTQTESDAEDERLLQEEERRKLQRSRGGASGSSAEAPTRSSPRFTKRSKTRTKSKDELEPAMLPSRSSKRIQSRREKNLVVSYAPSVQNADKGEESADDFDIPIAAQKQNSKAKGVSRRSQRIRKSTKSPKRGGKSKTAKSSDSESTNDAEEDPICTQESNVSEPLSISIKPIKVRKKRRPPTEEKLIEYEMSRKRLFPEELSILRMAFVKHYPPPPSNLQAQSRYEQLYGREMPQKMINGLWKCELQPWSDRWWAFYQKFNDSVREKKVEKPPHKDPTITKTEATVWAKEFYREHGDAKIPFVPPADDKSPSHEPSADPEPSADNKREAAGPSGSKAGAPDASDNNSPVTDPSNINKAPDNPEPSNDRKDVSASSASQDSRPLKKSSGAQQKSKKTKKARLVAIPISELRSSVSLPSRVMNDAELHSASLEVPVKNGSHSGPEAVPSVPGPSTQSQPSIAVQGLTNESVPTSVKNSTHSDSEAVPSLPGPSTQSQPSIAIQGHIDESAPTAIATALEAKDPSTSRTAPGAPVVQKKPPSVSNATSVDPSSPLLGSVAQAAAKHPPVVNAPVLRSVPLSDIQALVSRQPSETQVNNASVSQPVEPVTLALRDADNLDKNGKA